MYCGGGCFSNELNNAHINLNKNTSSGLYENDEDYVAIQKIDRLKFKRVDEKEYNGLVSKFQ